MSVTTNNSGNIQLIESNLQEKLVSYIPEVSKRAKWLIVIAVLLELVALALFSRSIYVSTMRYFEKNALFSGIAFQIGALVVFQLYAQAGKQLSLLHACVERTNRLLIAEAMARGLEEPERAKKRGEIITAIVTAPVLSQGVLEAGR